MPGRGGRHGDLEGLVDPIDVGLAGRRALGSGPGGAHRRIAEDGGHVVALGHPHVAPCVGLGQVQPLGGEHRLQGLHRRPAAEIDHGAGPVEHDGDEGVDHAKSPGMAP